MYENQPDPFPTNKAAVAAAASIIAYHFMSSFLVPFELIGAYTIIIEFILSAAIGLLASWPVRDRAGVPTKKETQDAPAPSNES